MYNLYMTRDHFKQTMFSPYFSSNHYPDTIEYKAEQKILSIPVRIKNKIKNLFRSGK